MIITKGKMADLNTIYGLYDSAREAMRKNGIFQWDELEPTQKMIGGDIEQNTLFVAQQRVYIYGAIVLNEKPESKYDNMGWISKSRPLYLHRLVVHPNFQGQGIGKNLLAFAEKFAMNQGYGCIRLDTHRENSVSIGLYDSFGYQRVGQYQGTRRNIYFVCYEKQISK